MILEKLVLENFRQFYGIQELVFATDPKKNVTLIHAENGFGKTALLNALLWGFYGDDGLTEDLQKPDEILYDGLAHHPKKGTDPEARITILFTDNEQKYALTRRLTLSQQKSDPRKTDLELAITDTDGQTYNESGREAQQRIYTMMPLGIKDSLFFNGEQIDHLAMAENANKVADAIHQVLGLHLFRTTIEDLGHPNVRGKLVEELRSHADEVLQKLLDDEKVLSAKIEELEKNLTDSRKNAEAVAVDIRAIDADLEANRETRELQERRNALQTEKQQLEGHLREVNQRLAKLVAQDGFAILSEDLLGRAKQITQQMRAEGRIPARVLNTFIQDLLKNKACICGCALDEGTEAHAKVKNLLTIAGDQHFNNAVGALDNAIGILEDAIPRTREALQADIRHRTDLSQHLRKVDEELAGISAQIGNKDDAKVQDLEAKRKDFLLRQRELDQQIGALSEQLKQKREALDVLRREVAAHKQREKVAEKAQRRLKALDETTKTLGEILKLEMEDLRQILQDEINSHFEKIIDRAYWVQITPEFVLKVMKKTQYGEEAVNTAVAASQGQRQITSLVFIASLVELARRRDEIPTILKGLGGGLYPIVMDSPFSNLGDEFTEGVAQHVPELAPQVAILVTARNYRGPVHAQLAISKRIGRRYLLVLNAPKPNRTLPQTVSLEDKTVPVYKHNPLEFTTITEL